MNQQCYVCTVLCTCILACAERPYWGSGGATRGKQVDKCRYVYIRVVGDAPGPGLLGKVLKGTYVRRGCEGECPVPTRPDKAEQLNCLPSRRLPLSGHCRRLPLTSHPSPALQLICRQATDAHAPCRGICIWLRARFSVSMYRVLYLSCRTLQSTDTWHKSTW